MRWFRVLLGAAAVLAAVLAAAALLGASLAHGPGYYIARSLMMGAWLWYLYRPRVRAFFREVAAPAPSLTPGRVLHFRLHANVTVRRQDEQGRSARHGLHTPAEQLGWLDRQGSRAGFDVLGADITRAGRTRTRKGRQLITLHTVTFEGALQVTDIDALEQAVRAGLGHAKSLGCGLLSLAP